MSRRILVLLAGVAALGAVTISIVLVSDDARRPPPPRSQDPAAQIEVREHGFFSHSGSAEFQVAVLVAPGATVEPVAVRLLEEDEVFLSLPLRLDRAPGCFRGPPVPDGTRFFQTKSFRTGFGGVLTDETYSRGPLLRKYAVIVTVRAGGRTTDVEERVTSPCRIGTE